MSIKIGELIEKERIKNNISKAKLAEKVGCTSRAIDYWENGERSISLDNADKIFKTLGITITIGSGSKFNEQ
ncbi:MULTISPECIES: helix-turn-helix transcriptional regulator [unclassified Clostridium]|uniref:helix-turn-helix transcriptional regulator n=1 Tax=unclassified Clostridium TaxID=2614128 RepID=UPI00207B09E1|nr:MULTISPECIES: helix-turn-helix transcriptional regulator [unclassified Clostridium]